MNTKDLKNGKENQGTLTTRSKNRKKHTQEKNQKETNKEEKIIIDIEIKGTRSAK